jgi:hypothetical protein
MNEIIKRTVDYFQAPSDYFWQWAENGEVIEWITGRTICYREDMVAVLKGLNTDKLPPLSSVLLVLASCNDNWKESNDFFGLLRGLLRSIDSKSPGPDLEQMEVLLFDAIKFLDIVNDLPKELRNGAFKRHLFHEVFYEGNLNRAADTDLVMINEFTSGRQDKEIFGLGETIERRHFTHHLEYLRKVYKKYPNVQTLEIKIRTGLDQLSSPVYLDEQPTEPLDLLGELEIDSRTQGVARLAKALIAALHIPMHANRSSDLSFGGFSDITNRGSFDRLLLSELAQEDLLFTARLVNNEAMFLRREEPPDQKKRERIVIVDSTIKTWGLPRVFAISAALGCSINKFFTSSKTYSLGSEAYEEIDLSSKNGVVNALGKLDAGINCFTALTSLMKIKPSVAQTECIFITDCETVKDYQFNLLLKELDYPLNYTISVSREGDFQLSEVRQGKLRPLSSAKMDLEDLLFNVPHVNSKKRDNWPAYLKQAKSPLYCPTTGIYPSIKNCYFEKGVGVIGVNDQGRVLHWQTKDNGARELLGQIENEDYYFGSDENLESYILVKGRNKNLLKFYKFLIKEAITEIRDLSNEVASPVDAVFKNNCFYIRSESEVVAFDCIKNNITERWQTNNYPEKVKHYFGAVNVFPRHQIKQTIFDKYSVPQKVKKIHVNHAGFLCLAGHQIKIADNMIKLLGDKDLKGHCYSIVETPSMEFLLSNVRIRFRKFKWNDGSQAIVDSRGFIHFKSSDLSLPEFTMVMLIGKASACWASDGSITGSTYLTDTTTMSPSDFYQKYFQPFINTLPK